MLKVSIIYLQGAITVHHIETGHMMGLAVTD